MGRTLFVGVSLPPGSNSPAQPARQQQRRPQDVMRSQCLQDALSLSKNEAVHNAAKDAA